ncbi:hypothetical protein SEENIN0B_03194 [Salmonella enterica subsp. enterica serovar Infantis str. SARB27]|uniref:Uncharacterized protein n=1 Tax=Salmonella enterica subsp. enterica serovar Infantis str. SARB27 TaxID=596155 RepID=A0A6C8GCH4_SALIN|nr:hypothetical protein SEENIN0B_03194 [Salmonella enterica subsp. enterica serovar Infantis str. SARB27]
MVALFVGNAFVSPNINALLIVNQKAETNPLSVILSPGKISHRKTQTSPNAIL